MKRLALASVAALVACSFVARQEPPPPEASRTPEESSAESRLPLLRVSRTHGCFADQGGLRCWGDDSQGQLEPAESLGAIRDLAVGEGLTCVCDGERRTRCWGFRGYGDHVDRAGLRMPRRVPMPPCESVIAGGHYGCSIDRRGRLRCWGQTPLGDPRSSVIGPRERDGWYEEPLSIRGLPEVVGAAGGPWHACAIATDQKTYCWGRDIFGELSDGARREDVVEVPVRGASIVAASSGGSCVIERGARVVCWGHDPARPDTIEDRADPTRSPTPRRVDLGHPIRQLAVGHRRVCALAEGGDLWCWGRPWSAPLGAPHAPPLAPAVLAQDVDAVALAGDGGCLADGEGVRCWGHLARRDGVRAPPGEVVISRAE